MMVLLVTEFHHCDLYHFTVLFLIRMLRQLGPRETAGLPYGYP